MSPFAPLRVKGPGVKNGASDGSRDQYGWGWRWA